MRIDEKFGTKEKMMDCKYIDDDDDFRVTNRCNELFPKTNNDLQNNVQVEDVREEQRKVLEISVEATTLIPNRNMIRNHPAN